MPFTVARDDTTKRIVATGEGEFRADDAILVLTALRDSGAWTYGMLFDGRQMSGAPAVADLKPIGELAISVDGLHHRRGPTAIVVTSLRLYVMACAFAAIVKTGRVAVFRDRAEADQWLADRAP